MAIAETDAPAKVIVYCWCQACDQPITGAERDDIVDFDPFNPRRFPPPTDWTVYPCGHRTTDAAPLFSAGVVTTVGQGVGPLPSIHIAGRG